VFTGSGLVCLCGEEGKIEKWMWRVEENYAWNDILIHMWTMYEWWRSGLAYVDFTFWAVLKPTEEINIIPCQQAKHKNKW
jgi:hypothetical protein